MLLALLLAIATSSAPHRDALVCTEAKECARRFPGYLEQFPESRSDVVRWSCEEGACVVRDYCTGATHPAPRPRR